MRYKQAVARYLQEKGYRFKALVAFSGTVRDGGADHTEANMNGFSEAQTAETFKRDEYRILSGVQIPNRIRPAVAAYDVRG